jgi:hypothetical protein
MKAQFDNATLKVWFANNGTNRNFQNVVEVEHTGNLMRIELADGKTILINFNNVNMVEEI